VKPRLLDLFCGAGGAAKGYADAGFDVVGVDIRPQPRYPYEFVQADAISILRGMLDYPNFNGEMWRPGYFDAIHASPPCQLYTAGRFRPKARREYPDLIGPTRRALAKTSVPWVIENVPGAPLDNPVMLCGAAFGLEAQCADGKRRVLQRHRLFESNVWLMSPGCACGAAERIGVYGNGGACSPRHGGRHRGYQGSKAERSAAMGVDWMAVRELSQAIPPAYTRFIGEQLLAHIKESDHV
jgi:DNA (cytosine-5)-methyltransferase 1